MDIIFLGLVVISFLVIGFIAHNRKEIFKEDEVEYTITFNDESEPFTECACNCSQIINLDNDKYYVELIDGKRKTIVIRLCFKNKKIFLK